LPPEILAFGQSVIDLEAQALTALSGGLDMAFVGAVEAILATKGRVVVSGMGKSGHVGRKIAATLASTGTPATFVHPGEAAHGDLGMLAAGDIALLISNSGETSELYTLIRHCKSLGTAIIAVSSGKTSFLVRSADYPLVLPDMPEACPVGIAPTTSTTMTLALGDALAMAVMRLRGFGRDEFRALHPGGKIDLSLAPVGDLMHGGSMLPLVQLGTPMRDVILEMTAKSFGIAGVVDEAGELVGTISDGDLRRKFEKVSDALASDLMSAEPRVVLRDVLASDALAFLTAEKITALFVVEGEGTRVPVGIVHIHDFLRLGLSGA
jgi:arabinose-5-phosphate isomerase